MQLLLASTSHAALLSVVNGEQRVTAAIPTILETADSPLRDQAIGLRSSLAAFANEATDIISTYTVIARTAQLRSQVVRLLSPPTRRMIEAGQAEARAIDSAWSRTLTVSTGDAASLALRQQDREAFASLPLSEKAAWLNGATVEQLAALMEAGPSRFPTVPLDVWTRAEERYAYLNFMRLTGASADYARQPTLEEPFAIGPDAEAVERAAKEALDRHLERKTIVRAGEQAIQGVCNVVALTCDLDLRGAFALLAYAKVAA